MSGVPLVSFIVPCYNYGGYLPECLDSIFRQEGCLDWEIIAIDDASTDDTQQVLAAFAGPKLRVVTHQRNLGHVATVNEGFGLARGRFIARIDPDDRYRLHFLRTTLQKLEQFPRVGLVYGDAALIDDGGAITAERTDRVHGCRGFVGNEFLTLLEINCICAPTAIARSELWRRVLPIPAGLAFNDWYFNIMMARSADFCYVDQVLADYRVHARNHHVRILLDRTEEASILSLLDQIFAETESSEVLQEAKRRAQRRVYGAQYLTLAEKYFGNGMTRDARRCYIRAIGNRPSHLLNFGLQRRLAATLVGRRPYELGKSLIKTGFAGPC